MSRASELLPVPFSPVMSTLASAVATRRAMPITACIAEDSPIIVGSAAPRRSAFSASSCRLRRRARPSASWLRMIDSSRVLSHGFSRKSRAPARIASTAMPTVAHAVITITGTSGSA
jgi:hypothetical protein